MRRNETFKMTININKQLSGKPQGASVVSDKINADPVCLDLCEPSSHCLKQRSGVTVVTTATCLGKGAFSGLKLAISIKTQREKKKKTERSVWFCSIEHSAG